jgi:oxalate decarboxylase
MKQLDAHRETVGSERNAQADAVVLSRRTFFERAALTGASIALLTGESYGQTRQEQQKGRQDGSSSDPGPENKSLLAENPNSNQPPFTDHGNPGAIWFPFDLAPKRIQAGGWTHQVTQRELPTSKDIAVVASKTAGRCDATISYQCLP